MERCRWARAMLLQGAMCDTKGNWILGFNKFLGVCSVLEAELWGIFEGLSLLLKQGFDRVLICTDCLEAV
uniref:RNase H type-1 domain-containing protein n=1 Tax=Gossypium raimondii TaxID=29730 RepID=A0A0D2MKQ8_GOSRA|nr:hypothetical protein B456_003G078100 [Gossypium raimondii]